MIKKLILIALCSLFLFADVKNEKISPKIVESGIKIIDIRTQGEWESTGIIKNSIPITFFNANGSYDVDKFLSSLDKYVSKNKAFALVCRSGNRTSMVSEFLSSKGYKVVNLKGGISSLLRNGYKLAPYKK